MPNFFLGLAQLCHRGGTTLPSLWQESAKPVAKRCQWGVEVVTKKRRRSATRMAIHYKKG
ncbi:MAG: hypothetical protein IIW32_02405 [Bacteroides sp.]|nr:hypothetical protein [Bacteroides sp.]